MTTVYLPAGALEPGAPLPQATGHYSSAAELVHAINSAASVAPECVPMIPRAFPAGAYEPGPSGWQVGPDGIHGTHFDWRGPLPEPGIEPGYSPRVAFHYVAQGTRGRLTVRNLRANLQGAADRVHAARPSVTIHAAHYSKPGPVIRIPEGDPRMVIPARFAPAYILQA